MWVNNQEKQVRPSGWQPWANTLAYYPLKNDCNDYSWNNRNGTGSNIQFIWGYAYWNGSDSTMSSTITNDSNKTVSLWVKWDSPNEWDFVASCWNSQGGSYYHQSIAVWTGIKWAVTVKNSRDYVSNSSVSNTRTHICVTFTSGNSKLYVNGEYQWANTYTYSSLSTNFTLFSRYNASWNFFKGYLSNVIVESSIWTDQEVADYYNLTKSNYGL